MRMLFEKASNAGTKTNKEVLKMAGEYLYVTTTTTN